ncbi:uncharacterized protein UHOD_11971 [Ustilago sp. UG-2017b]|nr:uncharacterized protein UHOD_11971 [Ustilago sp. UG-2017b]
MEHIAESTLLYEACKIHMFNADVCKLANYINEHWAKAETIGYNLMWVLKIKTLIDQAKFVGVYHNCIMNLQDNGRGTDYDVICVALFKCQDDMPTRPNHQTDSNKTAQTLVVSGQITNQDGYTLGKPGPDGRHRCYYCQGENHISRFCPKNPNNKLQTLGNTDPAPAPKNSHTSA